MPGDTRIPLRFVATAAEAGADEALLVEGAGPVRPGAAVARFAGRGHGFGCACCAGQAPAAAALSGLFRDRALGRVAWFAAVVAVVADPAAVADELRADRVAAARFRVVG